MAANSENKKPKKINSKNIGELLEKINSLNQDSMETTIPMTIDKKKPLFKTNSN